MSSGMQVLPSVSSGIQDAVHSLKLVLLMVKGPSGQCASSFMASADGDIWLDE